MTIVCIFAYVQLLLLCTYVQYVCMYVCMYDLWKCCGRLAEAMKHVFAMRLSLGDPAFSNTTGCTGSMLSDAYMAGELRLLPWSVCTYYLYVYIHQFQTISTFSYKASEYVCMYDLNIRMMCMFFMAYSSKCLYVCMYVCIYLFIYRWSTNDLT